MHKIISGFRWGKGVQTLLEKSCAHSEDSNQSADPHNITRDLKLAVSSAFRNLRGLVSIIPASADPEGGQGVRTPPPEKSQVIWVSIGNKQLDPPWRNWTPMENVGPSLEPCKMIVFF